MADVDPGKALHLGKLAVDRFRRSTWGDLRLVVDLWAEDIAQEVTIEVLDGMRQGRGTGLHFAVKKALNNIFGQATGHRHCAGDTFVAVKRALPAPFVPNSSETDPPREAPAVIAMWRLQRLWPTLSSVQRAAMLYELTGVRRDEVTAGNQRATARRVLQMVDEGCR